jgi:hypothetical protein
MSIDEEIIITLKKKAIKKHTSTSKVAESIFRNALRLK